MIEGMQNFLTNVMSAHAPQVTTPVQKTQTYSNPFANPFLSQNLEKIQNQESSYGKNRPSQTGYFAGYYNDKPNIVGRKLFIEI